MLRSFFSDLEKNICFCFSRDELIKIINGDRSVDMFIEKNATPVSKSLNGGSLIVTFIIFMCRERKIDET